MFETPGFGKKDRIVTKPEAASDFQNERQKYENIREHNQQINELLSEYDGIVAFQKAGHGIREDEIEKKRIEGKIREVFASFE